METALRRSEAANWDIRQGPVEGSRAGKSAWVERFPTWALGLALTAQPEFWDHVARIRDGAKADELARRYIRRNQGRRLELIATLLGRAAEAPDDTAAKIRIWNAGLNAYSVDGVPNTSSPQRALRGPDALKTLGIAAVRVARRGAGRCGAYDCPTDSGTVLASDGYRRDLCAACEDRVPPSLKESASTTAIEAERALFNGAIPFVLGGPSPVRARRERRRAYLSGGRWSGDPARY
jgi:hypothetical protein